MIGYHLQSSGLVAVGEVASVPAKVRAGSAGSADRLVGFFTCEMWADQTVSIPSALALFFHSVSRVGIGFEEEFDVFDAVAVAVHTVDEVVEG